MLVFLWIIFLIYFCFQATTIKLITSIGLKIQNKLDEPLTNNLEITLEQINSFSSTCIPIRVLADLPTKDHQVTISCPWSQKPIPVILSFSPPLTTSWKLYTVEQRKFIQISIVGLCNKDLDIKLTSLSISENVKVVDLNLQSSQVNVSNTCLYYIYLSLHITLKLILFLFIDVVLWINFNIYLGDFSWFVHR